MTQKDMIARLCIGAVSGILISMPATASSPKRMPPMDLSVETVIELAGADDKDRATDDALRKAGQQMVPADNLKKATHKSEPSATPAPMKTATDQDKMPAKAAPAAQTKPEPAKPQPLAKPASPTPSPMKKEMAKAQTAGFYIRGDIGYGFSADPDGSTSAGNMTAEAVDNAPLIGGGLGYRFNDNFRTDLTFDFRSDADVEATTAGGAGVNSEVNGWTLMANGYWDINHFEGITPYLGAGIGYALLETSDQIGGNAETGASSSNLAWAAMLGASVDIGLPQALLDIGYRYISLGEFQQNGGANYDDLMAHEIRAGLRYNF
ncbi:MAG: porin family protein [Rhodospirillaceae bacterium]|nr:porin family protein [Rhodospirillaceae bacterium]